MLALSDRWRRWRIGVRRERDLVCGAAGDDDVTTEGCSVRRRRHRSHGHHHHRRRRLPVQVKSIAKVTKTKYEVVL